jgi:hypothetical protein
VEVLRRVWTRHFVREDGAPPGSGVQLRAKQGRRMRSAGSIATA